MQPKPKRSRSTERARWYLEAKDEIELIDEPDNLCPCCDASCISEVVCDLCSLNAFVFERNLLALVHAGAPKLVARMPLWKSSVAVRLLADLHNTAEA
jgi:hypothetical protein